MKQMRLLFFFIYVYEGLSSALDNQITRPNPSSINTTTRSDSEPAQHDDTGIFIPSQYDVIASSVPLTKADNDVTLPVQRDRTGSLRMLSGEVVTFTMDDEYMTVEGEEGTTEPDEDEEVKLTTQQEEDDIYDCISCNEDDDSYSSSTIVEEDDVIVSSVSSSRENDDDVTFSTTYDEVTNLDGNMDASTSSYNPNQVKDPSPPHPSASLPLSDSPTLSPIIPDVVSLNPSSTTKYVITTSTTPPVNTTGCQSNCTFNEFLQSSPNRLKQPPRTPQRLLPPRQKGVTNKTLFPDSRPDSVRHGHKYNPRFLEGESLNTVYISFGYMAVIVMFCILSTPSHWWIKAEREAEERREQREAEKQERVADKGAPVKRRLFPHERWWRTRVAGK